MFEKHVLTKLDHIERMLGLILRVIINEEKYEMHTLQDVLNEMTMQRSQMESLQSLIAGLRQQAKDSIANANSAAEAQAAIDQVFDAAHANTQLLVDSLNANTGVTPTSTATPPVPSVGGASGASAASSVDPTPGASSVSGSSAPDAAPVPPTNPGASGASAASDVGASAASDVGASSSASGASAPDPTVGASGASTAAPADLTGGGATGATGTI